MEMFEQKQNDGNIKFYKGRRGGTNMLVTWQTVEEQLQVTVSANCLLVALRFLQPPSDEVRSHGSTLKFQLLFFKAVATALKASTAKKFKSQITTKSYTDSNI